MFALVLLPVALAAGCASKSPTLGGVPTSPAGGTGRLVVTQEMAKGAGAYIEGYVAFVKVSQGSQELFSARMEFGQAVTHDLPAGTYSLAFSVRPCDGNCGYLDPTAETCSSDFSVATGQTVKANATERPGDSCSIAFVS